MIAIEGDCIIVSPPATFTIGCVVEFVNEIKESLTSAEKVLVNMIGVTEIDSAGFQVLVALKKEVELLGKTFQIVGMSVEVNEIIALYDAKYFFEML